MMNEALRRFLFPRLDRRYLLRVVVIAGAATVVFGYLLIPFRVRGDSMWPTYRDGAVNFCFTPAYLFSTPERGDVVTIRLAGHRVMLLKRIVALENDTVAFQDGRLFVNQVAMEEPYTSGPCDWQLEPRQVKPGHVYVIGDNRSVPMDRHHFGQTPVGRVIGVPLW